MKVRTKFDIYVYINETETTMQLHANHWDILFVCKLYFICHYKWICYGKNIY